MVKKTRARAQKAKAATEETEGSPEAAEKATSSRAAAATNKNKSKAKATKGSSGTGTKDAANQGGKENKGQTARRDDPMYKILERAQQTETYHNRYLKELKQLYQAMDHNTFVCKFIEAIKSILEADDTNDHGTTAMSFCAKFVANFESEHTHPILADTLHWCLHTISGLPHVRYRICLFVNVILKQLGPQAALDDSQCDEILVYMLDRVKDVSASVRKQAVLAMQRLQMPDKPNDPVLCAYQFHLSADPSPMVRQCIVTCMGRNYLTIPHILQRLSDVDDKVRRHTYVNLCNYPVRSYKVVQRLQILEHGLNDSSENIRKTVAKCMLKAWMESYQQNFIALTAALKLYSDEESLCRFRNVSKQMLQEIFKQNDTEMLLKQLPLSEDCELHRCVPHESLTVESLLYWECLSEYLQKTNDDAADQCLPELTVFCAYVEKFCQFQKPDMDKFAQLEFQSMLLSLVNMLQAYDLGDEIGRIHMGELITLLLKDYLLDRKIIEILVRCMEQLITDLNARMQYFLDIIYEMCELNAKHNELVHDRSLINKLLADLDDPALETKISSLKVRILDLEEQEENYWRQKEYIRVQAANDEKNAVTEEYTELIRPLLEKHGNDLGIMPQRPKLSKQERVLKGLYITFYMVASQHVQKLTPSICKLYKDFICRHLASTEEDIFEVAIKCGSTFSILYEPYAKEVFELLVDQFCKNNNVRLCETSALCILELIDHHGLNYFIDLKPAGSRDASEVSLSKSKRRRLYTMVEPYDLEDERNQSQTQEQNSDIIGMMAHFMERVEDKGIGLVLVRGLCRLVLRGHLDDRPDVIEKLVKRFFNPNTEPIINQALGMFLEQMVEQKLAHLLEPCLLPCVWTMMDSDLPVQEGQPTHVVKFFIGLTTQERSTPQNHLHNKIAISFLEYIHNYYTDRKDMCRLLAKELINLQLNVQQSQQLKTKMLEMSDELIKSQLEPRMIQNIINFKDMVNGRFNPPPAVSQREGQESGGEEQDEDCETATVVTVSTEQAAETPLETISERDEVIPPSVGEKTTPTLPEPQIASASIVGVPSLRRSMLNIVSQVDDDLEADTTAEPVFEISKKNINRPQTKKRLEQAMARASKTPEKQIVEVHSEQTVIEASSPSPSHIRTPAPLLDSPAVIPATPSPIAAESGPDVSRRLRSLRSGAKTRVLHMDRPTPVRNGRKRILRRSPSAKSSSAVNHSVSPLPKQIRRDVNTPTIRKSQEPITLTASTNSPTGSSSSAKENTNPPPPQRTIKMTLPQSQPRPTTRSTAISLTPGVTTRNSARSQSNRKRLSLDMNMSSGHLRVSTPKRLQQDKRKN
ncbi:condensin complex subunit 3 [Drosophila tropicalis]|uniref:condensin complex subunit 3 n=1 Tax=Drosophila tropicalis TaxID=46794 RepID=UPI0035ABC862